MGGNEGQNQPVKPRLGLFDAVSIMVGIVIGATVYESPPVIFNNVSNPAWGIAVWVIGGVLSLIGALCYAELASTYPRMGGDYVYLSRAFGGWCGFLFGWAQLAVVITASIGSMAFIFSKNAVEVMTKTEAPAVVSSELSPEVQEQLQSIQSTLAIIPAVKDENDKETMAVRANWTAGLAIGAVVLLTLMNFLGVVLGKWVQNLLSLLKVVGLGAIIYIGFASPPAPDAFDYTPRGEIDFGLAMLLVLYAYGGWNDMAFVASELKNKRNIPRALILGTALITAIYVAVNVAYILALGFDDASSFAAPVPAQVLGKTLGTFAAKSMSVLVMVSALGAMNGLIFTGSRIYSSLGSDWSIFAALGRWSPRFGSPIWSLLTQGIIALTMIVAVGTDFGREAFDDSLKAVGLAPIPWHKYFNSGFVTLVAGTAPVFWIFFLLTGLSLFALRQQDRTISRPFSVPLFPLLPLIFCATCVFMLYRALLFAPTVCLLGFIPLAIGIPLYYLTRYTGAPESVVTEPPSPPSIPVSPPPFVPESPAPIAPESHAPSPFETLEVAPPVEPEVPPSEPVPPPDDNPFSFGGKPADVHE